MMSSRLMPVVVLVLLILATTMTIGLTAGHDGFTPCSGDRGAFVDSNLCDPDHLVSPEESYSIGQLLTKCTAGPEDVKMVMFLAANFTPDAHTTGTWNSSTSVGATTDNDTSNGSGNSGGDSSNIHLLKELVVTSCLLKSRATTTSNRTTFVTSSSSIILLVAIQDPFQLATWHSATLDGVLPKDMLDKAKQQVDKPVDQQHFTSTVVHVAHQLCQSVRRSQPKTLRDIILTVVWIAFTAAFVTLLIVIVMALLRGRYRAVTTRTGAGQEKGKRTQARRQHPITSTSDIQDLGAMYNKTSGNVLLGTTDITAVLPQDCSSTDNLLQG